MRKSDENKSSKVKKKPNLSSSVSASTLLTTNGTTSAAAAIGLISSTLSASSSINKLKQQKSLTSSTSVHHEHLLNKLQVIDTKIQTLTNKTTIPEKDQSYLINTNPIPTTLCPHCFSVVNTSELKQHLSKSCAENIITCPELGCGVTLPRNEMKNHLQYGCKVAKSRRLMANNSIKRKEEIKELIKEKILNPIPRNDSIPSSFGITIDGTSPSTLLPTSPSSPTSSSFNGITPPDDEYLTCSLCHQRVILHEFNKHQQQLCSYRKIFCPNRHLGCLEEVSLMNLNQHLAKTCEIEMKKEQLIQKSKKRLELVQCPGCGEKFPLGKLIKHEKEECCNRKVPCRNAVLGCPIMVRLKDRKNHEDVHSSIRPRSCLYFDGCDTQIALNESDISPPWTIEFWIYRPSVVETSRCFLREVLRLGHLFRHKILLESKYRVQIMAVKSELCRITTQSNGNSRSRSNNVFLNPEFTEITLKLAKMIQEYEKLALDSILYGQLYFIAIRSARTEIELGKASRNHRELLDLTPEVDGTPCKKSYHVSTLTESLRGGEVNQNEGKGEESNQETGDEGDERVEGEGGEGDGDGDGEGENPTVNGEVTTEEGMGIGLDAETAEGEEAELEKSEDLPEGFDELTTRMIDFDWNPKLWKEWGNQMKDLESRYEYDQEIITQWRVISGLINDTSSSSSNKKSSSTSHTTTEDSKAESKRLKQERREKREKKYKINKTGESKFSELAQNILTLHQGSSILCHSDTSNIYLHLSSSQVPKEILGAHDEIEGSLGYCDWLHGLVSFQYNVPREKWTHIAINATIEPKKRVYFYSDGVLMNTIKEKIFNLPMKTIGSPYLSYHGYVLDIRYWGKNRSVPEIKLDMKCLLHLEPTNHNATETSASSSSTTAAAATPATTTTNKHRKREKSSEQQQQHLPDLSGNNLIGWWTLEDGGYSRRIRDVSDHRFPSILKGGKIYLLGRETLWFEATSLLPLTTRETVQANPHLVMNIPHITVPLPSYLEKNLCPFEIRRSKLAQRGRSLLQYSPCPNNCQQHIRKINLRSHLKFECVKRIISCRYIWCGQSFPVDEERTHYTTHCAMIQQRNLLIQNFLQSQQVVNCTLCSKEIQLKELFEHENKICQYRTVSCRYQDCHVQFPFHLQKYHEAYECTSRQIQFKKWLIQRARSRCNYSRPWGIDMTFVEDGRGVLSDEEGDVGEAEEGEILSCEGDEKEEKEEVEEVVEEREEEEFLNVS